MVQLLVGLVIAIVGGGAAGAIIAARSRIVDGAVGMVEAALGQLQRDSVVELDESQRASLVSNLLVVLCSDRNTQPVIQTGS